MSLLPDEQNALTDWVLGFDQGQFAAFLLRNGAHRLEHFSSALQPMPVISGQFVLWLNRNPRQIEGILVAVVAEYPQHPSVPRLRDALQRLARVVARSAGPPWAAYLPGNVPVVNRAPLRYAL